MQQTAAQTQTANVHHKLGTSPLILFFLGALVGLLWLAGTVVQIQTSEYMAMGTGQVGGVAWAVLLQPWQLVTGTAPLVQATAWIYGWVVETITLIFATALSVAVAKLSASNKHLGRWFVIGGILLLCLNSYADYSSSPGSTPLVKALIALAVGGIVVVGLPIAFGLIEHGVSEW